MLTTVELCAGIGGFSSPHTRPIAMVEKEASCRAILRRHYPDALILDDVLTSGAHNLPTHPRIAKFGFPCQDLSVAGKRAGLAGARSGLFYECMRIADELRPDYILWENVPGLLSSRAGRDFLAVLTELDRLGFAGGWTTVDAQFFGVAQRRQRVFGLFARRDIGAARCGEILSLAARLPWNFTTSRKARQSVAATLRAGSASDGVNRPGRRGDDDVNIVTTEPYTFDWQAGVAPNDRAWLVDKPGRARALTANRTLAVCGALSAAHGGPDDNAAQAGHIVALALNAHPGKGGRAQERTIAGTFGVRRLTPVECERLQGFPDDYTAWGIDEQGRRVEMSDSVRYRMLGNAVCRNVSRWIDSQIVKHS